MYCCPYLQPTVRPTASSSSSSSGLILLPLLFLFFVLFVAMLFSRLEFEDDILETAVKPVPTRVVVEDNKEYKRHRAPRDGTVKLVNGKVSVIHLSIKKDSVILLSRKSIDQKAGSHLIIGDITPNETFDVLSTDEQGILEENDCGDIYFVVV